MAVQREQPSKKFLQILMKMACLCSNTCFSGLECSFPKIQKPRTIRGKCSCHRKGTQDSGTSAGKLHPVNMGNRHRIFTNFVQTTISLASNGLFQKFKKPNIISFECLRGLLIRSIININSLTAVLIINRCPSPVRGHHPILVLYARFIPLCQYPDIISHTF